MLDGPEVVTVVHFHTVSTCNIMMLIIQRNIIVINQHYHTNNPRNKEPNNFINHYDTQPRNITSGNKLNFNLHANVA